VQGTPKTVNVVSFPPNDLSNVTQLIMAEDEPRETVRLHNFDILQHLDMKLQHLPERERKADRIGKRIYFCIP